MVGMAIAATITLTSPFGTAEVATYGAVMKSWRPKDSSEVFAMAKPYDTCDPESQIHGGFPLCWPWAVFEGEKGCKIHGITRYNEWKVMARSADSVTLALEDSEKTRKVWPYAFRAELTYRLGRELSVAFKVVNRDTRPFTCTELFHPYFRVGDTLKCSVTGTDGVPYFWEPEADKGGKRKWSGDFSGVLVKDGAPGYVFEEGPHTHLLRDPVLGRTLKVSYEGNPKFVIWGSANDFKEYGGAEDPDFGRTFICVEGGNIYRDCAYTLKPGETHELKARIEVCPETCGRTGLLSPEVGLGWENGWVKEWRREIPGLEIRDTRTPVSDGLEKVVRRWTWKGEKPLEKVVLSVRYRMNGDPKTVKPFIPGVLLYGNPSNRGRTDGQVPVYAGEPGEFAIFEENRLPMPFCIAEDSVTGSFAALHTLPSPVRGAVRNDLWWSAGVERTDGGVDIVLLSGPIGYNRRRSTVKARQHSAMAYDEAYVTLRPNQIVEKVFWVQTGKATSEAFGFERALDVSLDLFRPYEAEHLMPFAEIVRQKRKFALSRWIEEPEKGICGFNMFDPNYSSRHITMGWCGCAATCGYALPALNVDPADWEKAQRSLDFLCDTFGGSFGGDGLFPVVFDVKTGRCQGKGDPVSCGQGLYSILKAIRFAERSGGGRLDAAKWRRFAGEATSRIAAAVLSSDWQEPKSTACGFLVAPLVLASELLGNPDCLSAAKRIAAVFERRYFGYEHVYWGGTLDANCEDKEGCYAAFQGYLELLRVSKASGDVAAERRYARLARHAMNMMLTYTMVWDVQLPPGRLTDHGFKSTGWTVVSPQNQCLDAFGVLTTPEIWRMGEYLGDERLKRLARVMYRSCFQLTDENGSLGEQILQTNYRHHSDSLTDLFNGPEMNDLSTMRGGYSEEWTVFWLTAHFLNAAAQFKEMGVSL